MRCDVIVEILFCLSFFFLSFISCFLAIPILKKSYTQDKNTTFTKTTE